MEKDGAKALLQEGIALLSQAQDKLYAQERWSILGLQGMDAAGKDSAIKHVLSGVNPQGCQRHSASRRPRRRELDHDFMWRAHARLPETGAHRHLQPVPTTRKCWSSACTLRCSTAEKLRRSSSRRGSGTSASQDIPDSSATLRATASALKIFLNVSRGEQAAPIPERLDEPEKNWKFYAGDVANAALEGIAGRPTKRRSATRPRDAPWYVVPADNKWFTRLVVAGALAMALGELDLAYPKVGAEAMARLEAARKVLE